MLRADFVTHIKPFVRLIKAAEEVLLAKLHIVGSGMDLDGKRYPSLALEQVVETSKREIAINLTKIIHVRFRYPPMTNDQSCAVTKKLYDLMVGCENNQRRTFPEMLRRCKYLVCRTRIWIL